MKAPGFWYKGGLLSHLLAPLSPLWAKARQRRQAAVTPYRAAVPVVCVGNLVAGGAGKTPVALSVAEFLSGAAFLSRGYGGELAGPVQVDPKSHDYKMVGDEPLLLAESAPCWVAKNRRAGARAAIAGGARALIMDDGFQNASLIKDLSLLVVDGPVGFGNGRCIPAGPLREPVDQGLARADAVVIVGEDRTGIARKVGSLPVLCATLEPEIESLSLKGEKVVAFAGIGRPEKFFESLEGLGAVIVGGYGFPDHHPYHPTEVSELIAEAERQEAALITTTKDYVRLPPHLRGQVGVLRVSVTWADEAALLRVLDPVLQRLAIAPAGVTG